MSVSIPVDCRDIIHGGDAFTFPGWQNAWFSAQLFRISGLTDVLAPIGVRRDQIQFISIAADRVLKRVPAPWIQFFNPADGAYGAWTRLGRPQIMRHLQRGFPQVFDRALMSIVYTIVYVEDFLQKELPDNFFEEVNIVPVCYAVQVDAPNSGADVLANLVLRQALTDAVRPCPVDVVNDALNSGLRLTFRNAQLIRDTLVASGYSARIVCSPTGKPSGSSAEVLAVSRSVKHPSVKLFMNAAS